MIKTVIFDIGGVLVNFSWDKFIHEVLCDEPEEIIRRVDLAVWENNRWDALDLGEPLEKVVDGMIKNDPACEKQIKYLFANIGKCVSRREGSIEWIKNLKSRGLQVLYLSNYSHTVMDANKSALDFLPYMDGGIFSCDVHVVKPNKKIYELLAQKYNLNPSECVFIDDLAQNIEGAKNFGFNGIKLNSVEQAQEDLNNMLNLKK